MNAFRVIISFDEKEGFNSEHLKVRLAQSLEEVGLKLLGFEYKKDATDICPEIPSLNRRLSVCGILVEIKDFHAPIPYEQIVLGSVSSLEHEYPFYKSFSITPDWVEI